MAYVSVPRDMTKVKTKVILNLTARQLICFGTAAVIGVPTFLLTRNAIGNSGAVLLMIGIMLPAFFIAMYEKDGQTAEKVLRNVLRLRLFFPGVRSYRTGNFYESIAKEGQFASKEPTTGKARKTSFAKRPTGKSRQTGNRRNAEKPNKKAKQG